MKITYGIAIEGLGQSTAKTAGLAWCYGALPTAGDYEWVGGLQSIPESISDSVNVYTGDVENSAFSFEIANADLAATKIFGIQAFTKITANAGFNATTTTLQFTGSGSTGLQGAVVFVGDEAILLTTHAGTGTYTSCVRGFWGTTANSMRNGDYVYTRNPYVIQRRVTLISHNRDTGVDTIVWRGFVDDVATSNSGKTIALTTMSLLAAIRNATINKGSPRHTARGYVVAGLGTTTPIFYGTVPEIESPRVNKNVLGNIALQIGETLVFGTYSATKNEAQIEDEPAWWLGAPPFEDAVEIRREGTQLAFYDESGNRTEAITEDAYEVFVADSTLPSVSSTRDLAYPLHPVAITMGFMLSGRSLTASGYDVFSPEWGLGLDPAYFDIAAIDALILETQNVKIDRWILGWSGDQVQVFSACTALLLAYGFTWSIAQTGLISVFQASPTSLGVGVTAQASPATPIPTTIEWRLAREGQLRQAVAEIGGMPWRDPDRVIVASRDGVNRDTTRRVFFSGGREQVYDLSTQAPQSDRSQVVTQLLALIVQSRTAAPIITVVVANSATTGVTYDLGAQITLAAPTIRQAWAVDSSGERIYIDPTIPAWTGLIISRRHELTRDVYTLDILLNNWARNQFVRWRAPSAVVESYNSGTGAITVDTNAFSTDDVSFFLEDMHVYITSKNGTSRDASYRAITDITGAVITHGGGPFSGVVAGDIVRIAGYQFPASSDVPIPGYSGRVWGYFANDGDLDGDDADIWG